MAEEGDNPKTSEAVGRVCMESFLKRPSTKPVAMKVIGDFMNNLVLARRRPDYEYRFDMGSVFLVGDSASVILSGDTSFFLFADGKLVKKSEPKTFPSLGYAPSYEGEGTEAFDLPRDFKEKMALLLVTGRKSDAFDVSALETALLQAASPEEWLKGVMTGDLSEESALAAFLAPKKRKFSLFSKG